MFIIKNKKNCKNYKNIKNTFGEHMLSMLLCYNECKRNDI